MEISEFDEEENLGIREKETRARLTFVDLIPLADAICYPLRNSPAFGEISKYSLGVFARHALISLYNAGFVMYYAVHKFSGLESMMQ